MSKSNQSGFAHLLLIIFLIIGLGVALFIFKDPTNLFPKAAYYSNIEITDGTGKLVGNTTDSTDVYIVLNLPEDWTLEGVLTQESEIATDAAGPRGGVVRSITIENDNEREGDLGGSPKKQITENFSKYLNEPIPWRLNNLKSGDTSDFRTVMVTFASSTDLEHSSTSVYGDSRSITLAEVIPLAGAEIPVDVILDQDLMATESAVIDFKTLSSRVEYMINDYANSHLQGAGINRKFKFNKVYVEQLEKKCEGVRYQLSSLNFPVRVYMTGFADKSEAIAIDNRICLRGYPYADIMPKILLHEFSHLLGLPDYYNQQVNPEDNKVVGIGIMPPIQDIMWHEENEYYSNVSKEIVNRLKNPLPGTTNSWLYYVPKQVVLQIMSVSGVPLSGVQVDVFPGILQRDDEFRIAYQYIPNIPSFSDITDEEGKVILGTAEKIFSHSHPLFHDYGDSALIQISYRGEVKYAGLTISDLNVLYLENNQTETAVITKHFGEFIASPSGKVSVNLNKVIDPGLTPEKEKELQEHLYLHTVDK